MLGRITDQPALFCGFKDRNQVDRHGLSSTLATPDIENPLSFSLRREGAGLMIDALFVYRALAGQLGARGFGRLPVMVRPVIEIARRHRGVLVVAVVASAGWVGVVVAYRLVLPVFGVLSPVTWTAIWTGWLWVIGVPAVAAIGLAARRAWWPAASVSTLAVLAAAGLWTVGPPELTPGGQFRQHRSDLARLAADYRTGLFDGDGALPWRMRPLSIDGQAHRRCASTDPVIGRRDCALYLPAWQDWRAESGTGFAYYPTGPGPDASIVTAAGDIGKPSRELGDGWWWVE